MGRKCKLTHEMQEKIVKYIEAGNYAKTACLAVGICEDTYYEWLKRAKESKRKNKYTEFAESIRQAHAKAEIRHVVLISKAAETDAKHAEWWLERTNWKKWGRKERIEHSTDQDKPFRFEFEIVESDKKEAKKKDDKDKGN